MHEIGRLIFWTKQPAEVDLQNDTFPDYKEEINV